MTVVVLLIKLKSNFVETLRKFNIAKLSIRKLVRYTANSMGAQGMTDYCLFSPLNTKLLPSNSMECT